MTSSRFETAQYTAEEFVESAGAILFHIFKRQVCLVYHHERNEWLLAKGRRNVGEHRHQTALREATEETGYTCDLLSLNMVTRNPPATEEEQSPDVARMHHSVTEPFMMTLRQLSQKNLKVIWWYIAAIREGDIEVALGEDQFRAQLFGYEEASSRLTFTEDRDVLRRAIEVLEADRVEFDHAKAQNRCV